ncbi:hypothetical protein [endosymbiont 'TC1' of Trimyema compressum]|uniref:hypothetical protein n=1 Tax=endosymbiont 'TC1' of Trimyema compressum TaxID=243899 RepID=UPI001FE0EBB7|nr:hypothetical protein [endosymbiont 'TC1' of Trimyema compressum]
MKNQLGDLKPETAIVLGSGLGDFVEDLEILKTFSFSVIPHIQSGNVVGHKKELSIGHSLIKNLFY